jgi:hypothetical protein
LIRVGRAKELKFGQVTLISAMKAQHTTKTTQAPNRKRYIPLNHATGRCGC